MTCIVGLIDKDGSILIGGDSAGVGGYSKEIRTDRKVFVSGDFVMGFTTSFRMGQLLAFGFSPPKPRVDQDIMHYMVNDFVDCVRQRLKCGGYAETHNGAERGGTFLVGYAGRLFKVEGDYQVGERVQGFNACGCGSDLALGSLHSTAKLPARQRVTAALEAAEAFSAGVCAPFHIETLKASR